MRQGAEAPRNMDPATSESRWEGQSHLQLGTNEMSPTQAVQEYS